MYSGLGKGQARRTDLCRQILCMENLRVRDHQQIKGCFLSITQEQILADDRLQRLVDLLTDLHCHSRCVVDPLVCHTQPVQQVVGAGSPFPIGPPCPQAAPFAAPYQSPLAFSPIIAVFPRFAKWGKMCYTEPDARLTRK
mgnify:CR=1 FL=1